MQILAIILYIVLAAAVVFFSVKLSDYVDLLDKKTNLSGAFLGGILLAAVTSLPELFTSLTATVFLNNPDNHLVLGNVLGSNAYNLMLFCIVFGVFFKKMVDSKVGKGNLVTIAITAALYVVTTIGSLVFDWHFLLWGWFNPMSLLVVGLYVLSIILTPKEEVEEEVSVDSNLTVKQIVILFVIFSVLLIGASIGVTYVVDWINTLFGIGATFGGALFLGVATSLPETAATFNLCRKKNFNAAYGNILGSGVFNFFILALADVLSFRCKVGAEWVGIYKMDQSAFLLIVGAIISLIAVTIGTILKFKCNLKVSVKWRIVYIILSVIVVASYVAFLVFSNIDLKIPFAPFPQIN